MWENNDLEILYERFDEIPQRLTLGKEVCVGHNYDDILIIKPRNLEDIKVINTYINKAYNLTTNLTQDDIDEVIIINLGCVGANYCEVYHIANCLDNMTKIIEEFDTDKKH